jgi:hypothetical protein
MNVIFSKLNPVDNNPSILALPPPQNIAKYTLSLTTLSKLLKRQVFPHDLIALQDVVMQNYLFLFPQKFMTLKLHVTSHKNVFGWPRLLC